MCNDFRHLVFNYFSIYIYAESDQVVISNKKHDLLIGGSHNTKQMFNGTPNVSEAICNGASSQCTYIFSMEFLDLPDSINQLL